MKYLLDSHTFIWWYTNHSNLSTKALAILSTSSQEITLSLASVWEMQIKVQLGKLSLLPSLEQAVELQVKNFSLQLLPIDFKHIFELNHLPIFADHRDPFDRLLIAQALHEGLTILSGDAKFVRYPVKIVW